MSLVPSSPTSVSSSSSARALSPSARERIAANKRLAEQKLATRNRQLQQQQALFPRLPRTTDHPRDPSTSPSPASDCQLAQ